MAKPKKITKEQLENLQEKVSLTREIQMQVGAIEGQKHLLLHQLAGAQDEVQKVKSQLQEEYGNVSIDINDGTITTIKEEV